jgi:hypothetical protein
LAGTAGGVVRASANAIGVVSASGAGGARASGGRGFTGKLVAGTAGGVVIATTDSVGVVSASFAGMADSVSARNLCNTSINRSHNTLVMLRGYVLHFGGLAVANFDEAIRVLD